jgi:hypothetical protein
LEPYYKRVVLLKLYTRFRILLPILGRTVLLYERFVPFFVSLLLNRMLTNLKSEGTIDNYFIKIVRVDKLNYRVDVRFVLTAKQVGSLFYELMNEMFRSLKK